MKRFFSSLIITAKVTAITSTSAIHTALYSSVLRIIVAVEGLFRNWKFFRPTHSDLIRLFQKVLGFCAL